MENNHWLVSKTIDVNLSKDEILEKLYSMLLKTELINNLEGLKKDLKAKEVNSKPYYREDTFFLHAQSKYVDGFCAAIIETPDKRKFCLSGWRKYSEDTLSKLYTLGELLNIFSDKE